MNTKAFLIAPAPVMGMHAERLNNGTYLNRREGIAAVFSADKRFVIIGDCWSVREEESPREYLQNTPDLTADAILEREQYWCGRYVLLLDDCIYTDACAAMNVFYSDTHVSNSLSLLLDALGIKLRKEKLYDGLSPDFVPGAMTQYDGVRRLLPSQHLSLTDRTVSARILLPQTDADIRSEEERIRIFADEFARGLKNLDRYYADKTKLIVCTGGRDSREVLAISQYAGLHFDACTLEHDAISRGDVSIPPQLCEALGRKHYYVKQDKTRMSADRLRAYDRHTAYYENGADRVFYACGQFEDLRDRVGNDVVLLRGSVWGVPTDYYAKDLTDDSLDSLLRLFPLARHHKLYLASLREWHKFALSDTLNRSVNYGERVFWDFREGCWLSSIEQTFDIYEGVTSAQPLNCRRLISLLTGFDEQDRIKKLHKEKITAFACPQLGDIPYDYQLGADDFKPAGGLGADLKKAFWMIAHFGPAATLSYLKNR